jgi:hypothetical protein
LGKKLLRYANGPFIYLCYLSGWGCLMVVCMLNFHAFLIFRLAYKQVIRLIF